MNKFDRILWRINGVVLLAVLALGVLPSIWSLVDLRFHGPLRQHAPAMVNESSGTHEKEFLQLGWPSRITGTHFLRTPFYSENSSRGSSFPKGSGDRRHTRNYLFVDHSDLSSWWLFDTFDRAILKEHDLRADLEGKDKPIIATVFEVATTTNGDHRVTEEDHVAVFFSAADGKKAIEIISPSDRIVSIDQVTNNQVLIVYQRGTVVTAALFSTQDGAKIKESPLPMNK